MSPIPMRCLSLWALGLLLVDYPAIGSDPPRPCDDALSSIGTGDAGERGASDAELIAKPSPLEDSKAPLPKVMDIRKLPHGRPVRITSIRGNTRIGIYQGLDSRGRVLLRSDKSLYAYTERELRHWEPIRFEPWGPALKVPADSSDPAKAFPPEAVRVVVQWSENGQMSFFVYERDKKEMVLFNNEVHYGEKISPITRATFDRWRTEGKLNTDELTVIDHSTFQSIEIPIAR